LKNIILTLIAFGLIGCSDSTSTPVEPKPEKIKPSQTQINQVLSALKLENSDVVDALYNDGGSYNWVVGVNAPFDGQGSWMGYAMAMCNTLYEYGVLTKGEPTSKTISHGVRVVEMAKFSSTNGNFRKASLGSCDCKTWKMNKI
jgi:hypothetical protein